MNSSTLRGPEITVEEKTSRSRFVHHVAQSFDDAGIDYVFLHDGLGGDRDSDLDVAIGPESLAAVDLLVRSGTLGRLLQRFDYDVPHCRFYVLGTDEPGRRYRQLDVACDQWAIGRYGPAVRVALAHSRRVDGLAVPEPAAQALYLAVKRARKGAGPADLKRLRQAFLVDPRGARTLLFQQFGSVGGDLAGALDNEEEIQGALAALARLLDNRARLPVSLARRAIYAARRVASRVTRPTGLVLGLAGPDGVGKSTLRAGLECTATGVFRQTVGMHLRPGLLPPPARLMGRQPTRSDNPQERVPSGPVGSAARISYLALDTIIGWPSRIWLPRVRSTLVLVERSLLDLTVDPRRYRLRGRSGGLLHHVIRVLPRPDLMLLLESPAYAIHKRKPELPIEEIERQLAAWRVRAVREPDRFRMLETEAGEKETLAQALQVIDGLLAERQGRLDLSALALECLGGPRPRGRRYSLVSVRGRPRWILPRGSGPLRAGLYRPASKGHRAAALTIEGAHRLGVAGTALRIDPAAGLAPSIAASLGLRDVELAAATPREPGRRHRALLSVLSERRVVAFAKVSQRRSELQHESRVLRIIASLRPERFVVPEVIDLFEWHDKSVLLLRPTVARGRADRDMSPSELHALVELAALSARLAPAFRWSPSSVAVHGDFCGWNSAPLADGRLALWDWEEMRAGLPLEDFFHWKVQRFVLLGQGSANQLTQAALKPDRQLAWLARELGADPDSAPQALRNCIENLLREELGVSGDQKLPSRRLELLRTLEKRIA